MKTRTEQLELTRHNVTPAQFLAYVRQQIKKRDFNGICAIDIRLDDFKRGGDIEFNINNTHLGPQNSGVHREVSVSKPYEMQTYVLNWDGTVYNHIMEFDFDDDKKGTGYFYYICTVEEESQEESQEEIRSFESFDHYTNRGAYAVRMYTKRGDGYGVTYTSDFEAAKEIRTRHGLSIGLEPEPTYKDFAYYPTIWEWNDGKGHYERVLGY